MIGNISCESAVNFLRTLMCMKESMHKALSKWNCTESVDKILEESPWIDEGSARILMIADDLQDTIVYGDSFMKEAMLIYDKSISTPKVQLQLYLRSPIVESMREIIDTGVGVENDIFMTWRGRFERAYIALNHLIKNGFDVPEYLNGKKDRLYETYEAQYGSLKEPFTEVINYCKESPLFMSDIVNKNRELFDKLFKENTEVDPADFEAVAEAVMPWDVVMFNRGELNMDNMYIERLNRRIEDPSSIYNDIPTIASIAHKIPEDRCKDMYKYEFHIGVGTIEYIKEDKITFADALDDAKKNMSTSFFS